MRRQEQQIDGAHEMVDRWIHVFDMKINDDDKYCGIGATTKPRSGMANCLWRAGSFTTLSYTGGSRDCLGTTSAAGGHNAKAASKPGAAGPDIWRLSYVGSGISLERALCPQL